MSLQNKVRLKIQEENKILEANLNSFGFLDAYFSYSDFKIVTKKFYNLYHYDTIKLIILI